MYKLCETNIIYRKRPDFKKTVFIYLMREMWLHAIIEMKFPLDGSKLGYYTVSV